jgi:hypothetical protein
LKTTIFFFFAPHSTVECCKNAFLKKLKSDLVLQRKGEKSNEQEEQADLGLFLKD